MQPHQNAIASTGVATPVVITIVWLLSLAHLVIPAEVQAALMSLLTIGLSMLIKRFGGDPAELGLPDLGETTATITQAVAGHSTTTTTTLATLPQGTVVPVAPGALPNA